MVLRSVVVASYDHQGPPESSGRPDTGVRTTLANPDRGLLITPNLPYLTTGSKPFAFVNSTRASNAPSNAPPSSGPPGSQSSMMMTPPGDTRSWMALRVNSTGRYRSRSTNTMRNG